MDIPTSPEESRREHIEAFPIVLADGNRWGFALPSPRLRPEVVEGVDSLGRRSQTIRLVLKFGYPLEIRRLVDDLRLVCDQGEPELQFKALISLAVALVCRAHEIDSQTAASLMEIEVDDLPGFVETVLLVVSGSPRKVDVDG